MPFEQDPVVLDWFRQALVDDRARVRRRALELLRSVDCRERASWLDRGSQDPDPDVAATALIVSLCIELDGDAALFELLESDVAAELDETDLRWEWEYRVRICRGAIPSSTPLIVWTREEDDRAAREQALMRLYPGIERDADAVAVVVDKRLVNQYTRSARSTAESRDWRRRGRPRYSAGD